MIRVLVGDMFESSAQTLVNTVNCVGVMGKGIALEFKKRFPDMFRDYTKACERGDVKLGRPYLHRSLIGPWILNFPTKDHWRSVARIKDIVDGLEYLGAHYREWGISSLAVPPLGCGEGGLDWGTVGPTLYRYLDRMAIPVELYAPYGTPHSELQPEFLSGAVPAPDIEKQLRPGWLALAEIVQRLDQQPYHPPVGRTVFQKIAYVATRDGIPTGLDYKRSSYGPFAANAKAVLSRLVNNGVVEELRTGTMFKIEIGPTFEDAKRAYSSDFAAWDETMDRVADLFMRLGTRQAELVATSMFVADELKAEGRKPSERSVVLAVAEWKQRRSPPFATDEVALAVRTLASLDWIDVRASADLVQDSGMVEV